MKKQTGYFAERFLNLNRLMRSSEATLAFWSKLAVFIPCLFAMLLVTGCASTRITSREQVVTGQIPRPDHIWVYNFAATPADVPADSKFAGQSATPPTAEQIALGRKLGSAIAARLAADIRGMGLPAVQVTTPPTLQLNDIVLRGYLVSVEAGSAAKRMTVGFGSGGSELTTAAEAYQMTANGLRKLGSGSTSAAGSKSPGAGLGAAGWLVTGSPVGLVVGGGMKVYGEASGNDAIEGRAKATADVIAEQIKIRCQELGWVN
jgi:Domain of unknown function (DUF4410)